MTRLLELRYDAGADASAKGWFLSGDSAERWLEELAAAGLAVSETRLFIVPKSLEDPSAAGVLVVPAASDLKARGPIGLPCQLIAGRLFIPADAKIFPPVTDGEIRKLCPHPINFFHPQCGLSAFDENAAVPISNLLEIPRERDVAWNSALPGVAPLPQLDRILLAQPPSVEDLFGGAEEDIGSDPLIDLPEAPGEPKDSPVQNSGRKLRRMIAKGISKAMNSVPRTASKRTWLNNIEDWAGRQLSGVAQQLDQLRNKELHRLLSMLEKDPEAGLRHAIPMSNFAHRGIAPPGATLATRTPNFDLGRIGGGGPADFWNIAPDLQEQLRSRYREMADREVRLGRFRRAAYIYAQLLGDLISAAKVLKQGRHFREAALLYEEHLKNPLEAAHCLAEGGLLDEAVERYAKLERWMEVADLHERMGNRAGAEEALRKVVGERIRQEFYLGAAAILEERLKVPDEALAALLQAWPASKQAAACAAAAFRLLARLGRHDGANDLVNRIAATPISRNSGAVLHVLFEASRDYPHQPVRHRAADLSRVLIAHELSRPALPSKDARTFMEALNRLAPNDRLLVRDTNRFLSRLRVSELNTIRITPPKPPSASKNLIPLRRIELPRQIDWFELRREDISFFAVGAMAKHLIVMSGSFLENELQSLTWPCEGRSIRDHLIFEPHSNDPRCVVMAADFGERFAEKLIPATDAFPTSHWLIGTPAWLNPQDAAFAFGEDTRWTAHATDGRVILSCHDLQGNLKRTIDITVELVEGATREPRSPLLLTCVRNNAVVALGNRLVIIESVGAANTIDLPGQAKRLAPSLPNMRGAVAIMMDHGAQIYWLGNANPNELDRDIHNPMGAFVYGGAFVLISGTEAQILDVDSGGVHKVTRANLPAAPRTIVSAGEGRQFAILHGNEITVFNVES
jgi:hypothetical protein